MDEFEELAPSTRKLLKKLINDYNSSLEPARRFFRVEDGPAYIYNLFRGKYTFSAKQYKEIYRYILKRSNQESQNSLINRTKIE